MISALLLRQNGHRLIACGLTKEHLELLSSGKPIIFDLSTYGLSEMDVVLIPGTNDEALKEIFERLASHTVTIDTRKKV